jgi:hypothetical protein
MIAITLRNIPLKLQEVIRTRARKDGLSPDLAVLRMLEEAAGQQPAIREPASVDDLDALAGTWSREEAAAFDAALTAQRQVDPDLWL